jgi:hypothetical protein
MFMLLLLFSFSVFAGNSTMPSAPPKSTAASNIWEFSTSINFANQANRVINKGTGPSIMSEKDTELMVKNYREALIHAEQVNHVLLEKAFAGWGKHFDQEYRVGLRLFINGNDNVDVDKIKKGQELMDLWGEWFDSNIQAIKRSK